MKCACGSPLHYTDPRLQAMVAKIVERLGAEIIITVGGTAYLVQRHYIALHGVKAWELPQLAALGTVRLKTK